MSQVGWVSWKLEQDIIKLGSIQDILIKQPIGLFSSLSPTMSKQDNFKFEMAHSKPATVSSLSILTTPNAWLTICPPLHMYTPGFSVVLVSIQMARFQYNGEDNSLYLYQYQFKS